MYTFIDQLQRIGAAALALSFFLILGILPEYSRAQCGGKGQKSNVTNAGTEFMLVFEQNEDPDYVPDSKYEEIYLASLRDTATVTITCRAYPSYSRTIKLDANQSTSYRISNDIDVLVESIGVVDDRAVSIKASSAIVCYGMNHKQYSTDAFLALPRNTAGLDYRAMSYYSSSYLTQGVKPSEFAVAAFEDNTKVTLIPSTITADGHIKGDKIEITLMKGQCYQIQADGTQNTDLTGSSITSDKPVVVYGGHVRAEVPRGYTQSLGSTSRDHLCEAIPPTSTWGQNFICSSFRPNATGDIVRVLALNDGTMVEVNGQPWGVPLGANEFRDTLILGAIVIKTSGPALVGEFAHTTPTPQGQSDPFLVINPPTDQSYTDFTFFTSSDPSFAGNQYVVIVAESSGKNVITLDGTLLPSALFQDLPTKVKGATYSIATVGVSAPGAHRITTTNPADKGITILQYGYGPVESYGYTAGALLKPLQGVIPISNQASAPIVESQNSLRFRNMLYEGMYLDSLTIHSDDPNYTIMAKHDVAYDIRKLESNEIAEIELVASQPLSRPITGSARLYYHTNLWFDLEPVTAHFTLYPEKLASVAGSENGSMSAVFPNPAHSTASLRFSSVAAGAVRYLVSDLLGRVIMDGTERVSAGLSTLTLPVGGLHAGIYRIAVSAADGSSLASSRFVVK